MPKSLVSLEMSKLSGSPELDPLGEELCPFDEEEDPQDRPNLELDPLGGTPLRCRSCLGWGTSQVQPGVDCLGNDESDEDGNDENVDDVEVTLPSQVKEEQVESLLVLVVVVTTALVIIVINMMI